MSLLATKLLDTKGDFEKVRIALNGIMPSSIGDWWCITMDKREMIKFKGHQLKPMVAEDQLVVPHFKGLIKNYRASFPLLEPQITKVKEKEFFDLTVQNDLSHRVNVFHLSKLIG